MALNLTNASLTQTNTSLSRTVQQGDDTNMSREAPWYWALTALAAALTVLGNCIVIYLISARRRLQLSTNWFILSLAVADLSVGVIIMPSYMLCTFVFRCRFSLLKVFYNLILYVVVCNMCVMTWDRFVAVTKPLKYRSWMTIRRVVLLISTAWLFPVLVSLCPLAWMYSSCTKTQMQPYWSVFYSVNIVLFELVPCASMLLIYCRVFAIARKHHRQISLQLFVSQSGRRSNKEITRRKLEKSGVKAVGFVVLFFVLCYSLSAYRSICTNWKLCAVSPLTIQISRLFLFWNSALNFFVYALLKKDIRRELLLCFPWTSDEHAVIALESTRT